MFGQKLVKVLHIRYSAYWDYLENQVISCYLAGRTLYHVPGGGGVLKYHFEATFRSIGHLVLSSG